MIRVQSTVYPNSLPEKDKVNNVSLGQLIEYWSNNGHFNVSLYRALSMYKTLNYDERNN
jgi:hypothetical protein